MTNDRVLAFPTERAPSLVVARFAAVAAERPEAVAVVGESGSLTYGDLNERANRLARRLRHQGVGGGAAVVLTLEPGPDLAVAVWAVLKAGGAYVPTAPADPIDRIATIAADAGAVLLLTQASLAGRLAERWAAGSAKEVPHLVIDHREDDSAAGDDESPLPVPSGEQTAYILYTSGSSGTPKGVMVPHRALAYYLDWHIRHLRREMGGVDLPLSSSLCFAAGVTQFYTPQLLGRVLHILPADLVRQPERLFAWYAAHAEYGLYCVPTLWNELLRFAETAGRPLTGPCRVLLSGEAASERLVERSRALWPDLRLWNLYGPTEATANGTAGELRPGQPVSLGQPLAGTEIFLVDEDFHEVPAGAVGELCIAGPGVALGYRNLPELTAARFRVNPFGRQPGQPLFRTGDLAQWRDGRLVFLGRQDFQVKIRGFRIECGEIEEALQAHGAVRQALVTCQDGATADERRLVAYLCFHFARHATVDELRAFLGARLPDYMIPAAFVALEAFPKLANGKIDRKKLPPPGAARPALAYAYRPPATRAEQRVVRLFEEILGIDGLGGDDNFFDLGGNSLRIAALLSRLTPLAAVPPSYRALFDAPTPAGIVALLGQGEIFGDSTEAAEAPSLRRLPPAEDHPCTDGQKSLWLLEQTFPGQSAYNMRFSLRFEGPLERPALEQALAALVERHAILRSVIAVRDDQPGWRVLPIQAPALPCDDLTVLPAEQRETAVENWSAAECLRPFALDGGPLWRVRLFRLDGRTHHLSVIVHHLVFDGRSIALFAEQLTQAYQACRAGKPPVSSGESLQYGDWVGWRQAVSAESQASALDYWRQALEGAPQVLNFPTDYVRPDLRGFSGAVRHRFLDAETRSRLAAFSREAGVTPFMTLLALFHLLLARTSGQDDILVGTPVANRDHPEVEGLIGYFANTIVLRGRIDRQQSFRRLLAATRETCLAGFEHQAVPFEAVVGAVQPERSLAHAPLFQVMFAYHQALFDGPLGGGLSLRVSEEGNSFAKFDLVLEAQDSADELDLRLSYNSALYADASMERFLDHFVRLLRGALAAPDSRVTAISLLSADEAQQRSARWNATMADTPWRRGLHRLFEEQAARTPERIALSAPGQRLTYDQLNRQANRLARHLVRQGAGPGRPVGLHLDPSADMIVGLLAILKTGGPYVPLDPFYPPERLSYMAGDAGLTLLVTQQRLATAWRQGAAADAVVPAMVLVDAEASQIAGLADDDGISPELDPDSLIYLMYTSGSTGQPKGVMVPHRGAANYVLWMRERFPLSADDAVLGKTSINFDISVWEIFLPLISGARLVVGGRDDLQAPETLAALIRRERVTQAQFVPSALRGFLDAGLLPSCGSLRRLFAGGEALPLRLQQEVFAVFPGELHNLYGPTEASIYSCHWACRRDDKRRSVPIGGPIHNTAIHILDDAGQPVPEGIIGELYIGGVGVALGYRGKEELTRTAFPADSFRPAAIDGEGEAPRLFRTGDLARYWSDGAIEFLGRRDHQVKVRGYRIELGEIEHHLSRHPGIRHAIIIAREDSADDVRLVAYLLYRQANGPGPAELRDYLRRKLPDYMVPASFVVLDQIPLLPNNKANIAALPKPDFRKTPGSELERAYADDTERALAEIWEEVLETSRFGPEDGFFDLGGHSLLIARLRGLIERRLGVSVSNIDLFQYPTIRSLARHLSRRAQPTARVAADMARRAGLRNQSRTPHSSGIRR